MWGSSGKQAWMGLHRQGKLKKCPSFPVPPVPPVLPSPPMATHGKGRGPDPLVRCAGADGRPPDLRADEVMLNRGSVLCWTMSVVGAPLGTEAGLYEEGESRDEVRLQAICWILLGSWWLPLVLQNRNRMRSHHHMHATGWRA